MNRNALLFVLLLGGLVAAQAADGEFNYENPSATSCSSTGFEGFVCGIMKTLLKIGPMIAVIALVLAGFIYIYANVLVTADQRGKYHTLATSLAVGAVILAALVGGAGLIAQAGTSFLK